MIASRATVLRRELTSASRIPYAAHVAPHVVRTSPGDFLQVIRLQGASFETADGAQLNNWHERLNVLWRNLGGPNVAIWTHVIRRRVCLPPAEAACTAATAESRHIFADALDLKYRQRLERELLMSNELFLSLLYRPSPGAAGGLAAAVLKRARRDESQRLLHDAVDACSKLAQAATAALHRYDPELLGTYRWRSTWCSSLLEFLGLLINGEWQRMPLPRVPLGQALATSRILFGHETIEVRSPTHTRIGGMLGIKEYPTPSMVGMYGALLSAPFEFVLTQSFTFLTKGAAQALLQRQFNRMANAGDFAVSQACELKDALDALTSNEFVMGDHHLSLHVVAQIPPGPSYSTPQDGLTALNDRIAMARAMLADTGMLVAREDLAMEGAFWAQLPGNFPLRPRKAPITSRNFAAMSPFHNYPCGRLHGNHWGAALATFVTPAGSPYHFSLHASDSSDADGGSRKDTAHTLICGPTGSGKTVFIGYLITMLHRRGVGQVVFDKDRGLEILLRALGGDYLPLRSGHAMGLNPLRLPATPENLEFLETWLRMLCAPANRTESTREAADLSQALRGTLELDAGSRRLSRLIEFLDPTDPEGPHARLAPWCESHGGARANVFDNPADTLVPRLARQALMGFDVTEFLDNPRIRTPVTFYLFHLVRRMLDGRRLVCWMDEFWRLLADPAFETFAKDGPKTWRKLNAAMCLATQSASDVLESSISRTLIEQTPTKVFFPNDEANHRELTEGFGLSEREFALIKEHLEPGSRCFLVKQGHHSVICRLDLKGFDAELAVISGRAADLDRVQRLMAERGSDPGAWLTAFMNTVRPS